MDSLKVVAFLSLIGALSADSISFKDCGSKGGKVTDLWIDPCAKLPCVLKMNTQAKVGIQFDNGVSSTSVYAMASATVDGVPEQLDLDDPYACDKGVKCPVKPGSKEQYNETVSIDYDFPTGKLVAQWELEDDNGNAIICVQFPVDIED